MVSPIWSFGSMSSVLECGDALDSMAFDVGQRLEVVHEALGADAAVRARAERGVGAVAPVDEVVPGGEFG